MFLMYKYNKNYNITKYQENGNFKKLINCLMTSVYVRGVLLFCSKIT